MKAAGPGRPRALESCVLEKEATATKADAVRRQPARSCARRTPPPCQQVRTEMHTVFDCSQHHARPVLPALDSLSSYYHDHHLSPIIRCLPHRASSCTVSLLRRTILSLRMTTCCYTYPLPFSASSESGQLITQTCQRDHQTRSH